MVKTVIMVTACAWLVLGCAAMPADWGGSGKVLFSSADRIKIQWDNWQTNETAVRAKAVEHCGGRGVEEIDADIDPFGYGPVRSKTWRCTGK